MQVTTFVNGLFETRSELGAFKNQLRDFLIQSKEFSAQVRMSLEWDEHGYGMSYGLCTY